MFARRHSSTGALWQALLRPTALYPLRVTFAYESGASRLSRGSMPRDFLRSALQEGFRH